MYRSTRVLRSLLASSAAIVLLAGSAHAADESTAEEGGWGVVAGLGTLLYSPTKVLYAGCGLLFGSIAWGLSGGDNDVFNAVVTPAVRGDYVLQPAHIQGRERLEFFGRDPRYDSQPMDVAAEPPLREESF